MTEGLPSRDQGHDQGEPMSSPRILVAEDDRFLASLIRQTLEAQGMKVWLASDGGEAAEAADTLVPDLFILDAKMPVLTGFELLGMLRREPLHADTPVLMLTSVRVEADVRQAIAEGASDYMTKPFRPDQLVRRVRRLLAEAPAAELQRAVML